MYKFECTKCGDCCRWEGTVKITKDDAERASSALGLDTKEFQDKCTKIEDTGLRVLKNKGDIGLKGKDCIFLEDNKCLINFYKPRQCQDFPKEYDPRCPGFTEVDDMENGKNKEPKDFDKAVIASLFESLRSGVTPGKVASLNLNDESSGMDAFLDPRSAKVRIASLDDLYAFHREGSTLIHKANKELWSIEKSSNGEIFIARHFDPSSGEPLKV